MKAATTMVAVLAMTAVLASPSAAQSADGATVAAGLSWLIDEGETAPGVTFDVHVPLRASDAMTLGWCPESGIHRTSFGRGIPPGGVAPPSNTPSILGRLALPFGRRAPKLVARIPDSGH